MGDLVVWHALIDEARRLPAMREGLQFRQRAEIAEEALELVARMHREERVRYVVETGERLDDAFL